MKTNEELYYYCQRNGIVQDWLAGIRKIVANLLKPYIHNPTGDLMATKLDSLQWFVTFENIIKYQCYEDSTREIMARVLDWLFDDIAESIHAPGYAVFFRMNQVDYQSGLGLCIPQIKDMIELTITEVGVDTLLSRIQTGYYS